MADMKPVLLKDVVDALDMASDTLSSYLNRKTGELVSVTEDVMMMAQDDEDSDEVPEWAREEVLKAKEVMDSDDYIGLPDSYEINEYGIMEDFCYSLKDERLKEDLLYDIKGRGAFRRFKDSIHRRGIEKDWYQYRDGRLEEIIIDWLEANEIPFTRDDTPTPSADKS
jgi:hypothetical protein